MFDPNKPVPPEILQAMLELSTADDERSEIDKQMQLSEMLAQRATALNKGAPGIGGAASAVAQGLQGYMAGKQLKDNRTGLGNLRSRQQDGRRSFFNLLQGQQPMQPAIQAGGPPLPRVPPLPVPGEEY